MAFPRLPYKDPDAIVDYGVDWIRWLNDDTIVTSVWLPSVPSGITEDHSTNTPSAATIWLASGTIGISYRLTNRIVTALGRTRDQTIVVPVRAL